MILKRRNHYKQVGKKRDVLRFAWLPKRVNIYGDPYTVWLQWYWSIEVYEEWQDPSCGACGYSWNVKERKLNIVE